MDTATTPTTPAHRRPDVALLERYAPAIRMTQGELFLPASVEAYVRCCSLWASGPGGVREVVPAGELTIDRLAAEGAATADPLSLRFVQKPLRGGAYRRWRDTPRPRLDRSGRFQTAGMLGRIADGLFRATLVARGRVPRGSYAAAEMAYRERIAPEGTPCYGRVVHDGGWIVLQYWFFYAMNDWRSSFGGVNDHEADWEMITVYLAEEAGGPVPRWVAFSSHDSVGDDLRRRWDDPKLILDGEHPVVHAGAGSHSGAFAPGDYVTRIDPPALQAVARIWRTLLRPLGRGTGEDEGVGIPYVDYARGDGPRIGGSGEHAWSVVPIDDDTPWVRDYRGLWGLDTRDPLGGERAPAGPRYERSGAVRHSWADPLGWAGLQKVPPTDVELVAALERRVDELGTRIAAKEEEIDEARALARSLAAARVSLDARGTTKGGRKEVVEEMRASERELTRLVRERATLEEERRLHHMTLAGPAPREAPDAHVTARHAPLDGARRTRRVLSFWAAVSAPLFIASLILVALYPHAATVGNLLFVAFVFGLIEAALRGRAGRYLGWVLGGVVLVLIGLVIAVLLVQNWRITLAVLFGIPVLALLWSNLRELARR